MSNGDLRITRSTIFGKTSQQIEERIDHLYELSEKHSKVCGE